MAPAVVCGDDVLTWAALDWDKPLETSAPGTAPPKELVEQAEKVGARRKKIVRGEGGFHMNRSQLPPGYRVPPHHHNHDEMLVILAGGCTFDWVLATANDFEAAEPAFDAWWQSFQLGPRYEAEGG